MYFRGADAQLFRAMKHMRDKELLAHSGGFAKRRSFNGVSSRSAC
jgi:hypothetical protein